MDIHQDERDDFNSILKQYNYSENDFHLSCKDSTKYAPNGVTPLNRDILVKRISTKKEEIYRGGHGTNWLADFEDDLQKGNFN